MNIFKDINLEKGPVPIYSRIENCLEEKIKSGKLPYMAQLPTETELAKELNLNRFTVRQAYNNLKKRGLIQSLKAKGTFVLYDCNLSDGKQGKGKVTKISLVIPDENSDYKGRFPSDFVQLGLIRGISRKAEEKGIRCEIQHLGMSKGIKKCAGKIMENSDGVIFIVDYKPYKDLIEFISGNKFPYIVAYGAVDEENMNRIYPGQDKAAFVATEYLISLGHKRIALINGSPKHHWGYRQKLEGFKEAMKKNRCPITNNIIELSENTLEASSHIAMKLLGDDKHPTAFLCCNDLNLKAIMDAAQKYQIRIPEEISVMTFDAGIYGNFYPIQITSMDTEHHKIGESAVELLSEIKDGSVNLPVNKITEIKMTFGESVSRVNKQGQ